jgi:hypothetical protein
MKCPECGGTGEIPDSVITEEMTVKKTLVGWMAHSVKYSMATCGQTRDEAQFKMVQLLDTMKRLTARRLASEATR